MTLRATLSMDDAIGPLWDAIVIGAGPAGAIAARELARRGASDAARRATMRFRAAKCAAAV